jgi:hypothetical protein
VPAIRAAALLSFSAATVVLIPLEHYWLGAALWLVSLACTLRDPEAAVRRRLGLLLACVAILAAAPIHTGTDTRHFFTLGVPFAAVILLPALVLARTDPGVIRYRFWPHRFRWLDLFYVAISFPLAYWVINWYFHYNDFMPFQWTLPAEQNESATFRLFLGINAVGIWDELFFVNTVYAVLRSFLPFRIANLVQAVVYTSVLTDMAFIGVGPILVYLFALTQGSMFEESENLLYVLIVHVVVDYFLFAAIAQGYYPGFETGWLFH